MNPFVVIGINGLLVSDQLGHGDLISGDLRITNDRRVVARLLPDWLPGVMGKLDYHHLLSRPSIAYWTTSARVPHSDADDVLDKHLKTIQRLLTALWMGADNAANSDTGFFVSENHDGPFVHSNHRIMRFCKADGSDGDLTVTRDELRIARLRARQDDDVVSPVALAPKTSLDRSTSRFDRAVYFVQGARAEHDLGLRVASYVQALEALFCAGTGEIAHALAERCAVFLSSVTQRRMEIYNTIKDGYAVRSRVFHGDALSEQRIRSLAALSTQLDGICRTVIVRVITDDSGDFDGPAEHFEKAMIERVLRVETPDVNG